MALWFFNKVVWFLLAAAFECILLPSNKAAKTTFCFWQLRSDVWWTLPHHLSTFALKFKCKICAQKEVIRKFKNHILVTWPATNLLILRKWCGFEKPMTIVLFKIWPTNRFSKAKSYNFHFYKNDVTWPLSANGLLFWYWRIGSKVN